MSAFWNAYNQASAAGEGDIRMLQDMRKRKAGQVIGGAMARGDYATAARLAYETGDFEAAQAVQTIAQREEKRTRGVQVAKSLAANDPYAAEQTALNAGDVEQFTAIRSQVEKMAEGEKARLKEQTENAVRLYASAKALPYAERKAFLLQHAERFGVPAAEAQAYDPSDQNINADLQRLKPIAEVISPEVNWQKFGSEVWGTRKGEEKPFYRGTVQESVSVGEGGLYQQPASGNLIAQPGQPMQAPAGTATRDTLGNTVPPPPPGPVSYQSPLPGARTTDEFGDRGGRHNGDDLIPPAGAGAPVLSAAEGVVESAGWDPKGGGNYVRIRHADGKVTSYSHLADAPQYERGARIGAGQTIGRVGSSGNSTGPHLHFRADVGGQPGNPRDVLGIRRYIVDPNEGEYQPALSAEDSATDAQALLPAPKPVQVIPPRAKPSDARAERDFAYRQRQDAIENDRAARAERRAADAAEKGKEPTIEARKTAAFTYRTLRANDRLNALIEQGVTQPSHWDVITNKSGDIVRVTVRSQNDRRFMSAAKEWLSPILRKDTGAAVTDTEFLFYADTYIPAPGDGPEVLRQKAEARHDAMTALAREAGPLYGKTFGDRKFNVKWLPSSAGKPKGDGGWKKVGGARVRAIP